MSNSPIDELTRRQFLRTTSAAAAAASVGGCKSPASEESQSQSATRPESKTKPLLPAGMLGRTKHPTTLISFGAILISEKLGTRILKTAIDRGVNLVHTSARYLNGKSLRSVGDLFKAEKSYRDKVFLCVKSFHPDKESEIDEMLEVLGTDYVDAVLTILHQPEMKQIAAIRKQQDALKKKGKARHTGFVCHGDMNGVMEMVLKEAPDYFEMTLMSMKMAMADTSDTDKGKEVRAKKQRFGKNLKALRAKNIGILAMKSGARNVVQQEGKVFQAHAKAVFEAGADSLLTSINSFSQVEMIRRLDLKSLHPTLRERKAAAEINRSHAGACLMCADCTKACPQRLPISDLMRIRMYHAEYGWHDHARAEYAALGVDFNRLAANCGDCSACTRVCPVDLASPQTVRQVASLFS